MSGRRRDDLIDDVTYGRLTPAEAEAEASDLGLEPLARTPDPLKFNPMAEVGWTLPLTVAWIAWRDPEQLIDWYDPYRAECRFWQFEKWRVGPDGPIHEGYFLKERAPATLVLLSLSEQYDIATGAKTKNSAKVRDAKNRLWKALQEGRLEASGFPTPAMRREAIPAYEWHDLIAIEERGRDVLRHASLSPTGYERVLFPRQSVMALWPELRHIKPVLELPPTVRPEGMGDFPLYCAVQWIATLGGTSVFDPADESVWKAAFDDLKAHIRSGLVSVTGVRNGVPEKIDGHIFSSSLRVAHSFAETPLDLILSEDLYLSSFAYLDPEHWHNGFDDSLRNRDRIQWSKLTVLKSEVAKIWPFQEKDQDAGSIIRTGAAGRPTPIHLVKAEHRRRLTSGTAQDSVTAESERLAEWLGQAHPNLPQLTPKTIRNNISTEHRTAKLRPK